MVFRSALGNATRDCSDEQLAKIQRTILVASAPLANFWSHMEKQGIKGTTEELIPTDDVVWVMRHSLALLGNASCYISQVRRTQFINSIIKPSTTLSSEVPKRGFKF